ncbi:MAG: hypothetical protein J7521_00455 [Caulobacter sp.]|nr:hypothetical protein [Caulobacter sp.]
MLYFLEERTLAPFQIEGDDELLALDSEWAIRAFVVGDLKRERDLHGPPARKSAALQDIGPAEADERDPMARLRAFVVRGLDAMPETPRTDKSYRIALAKLWAAHPDQTADLPQSHVPAPLATGWTSGAHLVIGRLRKWCLCQAG